jgi:hypothetical protein
VTADYIDLEQWQLLELYRCLESPVYFLETFGWLEQKASAGVSEFSATVPFQMGTRPPTLEEIATRQVPEEAQFYFQRYILEMLIRRESIVTLKSRRVGCSWIAAGYIAWLVNFFPGVKVGLISRTEPDAIKLLSKVKFILKNLAYHDHENIRKATKASWLCGTIVKSNDLMLSIGWQNEFGEITAESIVESMTTTDNTSRGDDCTFLVFDELDFYEHPDETWSSATKAMTRGGHYMAISTPNQIGQIFHRLCSMGELAMQGKLQEPIDFEYVKIHWSEAGITEEQIRRSSTGDTQEKIRREWEWEFTAPGTVVFNPTYLAACYKPLSAHPEIAEKLEKYRQLVMESKGRYKYYSGADTIEGRAHRKSKEKDWNSWTSLTSDGIQAYHYCDQSELKFWAGHNIDGGKDNKRYELKGRTSELHEEYPGRLHVEQNGPGLTVCNNHQVPKDGFSEMHRRDTRHLMKIDLVEKFMLKVEALAITITDPVTYLALSVFQKGDKPGTFYAPPGFIDDPVMSILLASEASDAEAGLRITWGKELTGVPLNGYGQPNLMGIGVGSKLATGPKIKLEPRQDTLMDIDSYGLPEPPPIEQSFGASRSDREEFRW